MEHTGQITVKEYLSVFESYLRSKCPQIFHAMNGDEASVVQVKHSLVNRDMVDIIIKIEKDSDERQSASSGSAVDNH